MQKQDESTKTVKIVQIDDVCRQTKKQGQVPIKHPRKKKGIPKTMYTSWTKRRELSPSPAGRSISYIPSQSLQTRQNATFIYDSCQRVAGYMSWSGEISHCSPLHQRKGHRTVPPPVVSQHLPKLHQATFLQLRNPLQRAHQ